MENRIRFLAAFVRFSSLAWFIRALDHLLELPTRIMRNGIAHPRDISDMGQQFATMDTVSTLTYDFRVLLYVGLGIIWWKYALPIAEFVSKGLLWESEAKPSEEG